MPRTTGSGPGSRPTAEPGREGTPAPAAPLLTVEGLHVSTASGEILRGVELAVPRGAVVGVVGESGSGKTTLGLAVLGLLGPARRISAGEIRLEGELIGAPGLDRTAALRGSRVGFVPQDPFRSLDPLRRVGPQVRRPLELHRGLSSAAAEAQAADLLGRLGVADPTAVMARFPHELSGGLLQRATIAAALSCEPQLVIADEPTTALDALVQVQVIESFMPLVRELGTSLVVITHDLRLLARMADHIAVLYAGRIAEFGPAARMLSAPHHPYPAGLLRASLRTAKPGAPLTVIEGQPPALPGTFAACAFAPRCGRADGRCYEVVPAYDWPAREGYACHHPLGVPAALPSASRS